MQRLPEVFAQLRGVIDKERRKGNKAGQFLFLGSASIDLLQQSSESLAGRISYIELYPVDVLEYAGNNIESMNTSWDIPSWGEVGKASSLKILCRSRQPMFSLIIMERQGEQK
ncbi:AAA family ATPase [Puia sp.]|uniref:AAA family ATPase n=1 Tax=Puia sp. TaxID=2045100 RepID=UPI0039C97F33